MARLPEVVERHRTRDEARGRGRPLGEHGQQRVGNLARGGAGTHRQIHDTRQRARADAIQTKESEKTSEEQHGMCYTIVVREQDMTIF